MENLDALPKNLLENLSADEEIIAALKTRTIAHKPDYTILTNRRIIYFNEKYLGRYEMKVIPYQKLEEMTAERGRVRFGSIVFKSEEEEEVNLNKVPKDDIEEFVNALEEAINAIAAEPVSITRKKGMMGKMEWQFLKPPEMVFRSAPQAKPQTPSTPTDPLAALKMRFVRGEITEEEYKRMKEILE